MIISDIFYALDSHHAASLLREFGFVFIRQQISKQVISSLCSIVLDSIEIITHDKFCWIEPEFFGHIVIGLPCSQNHLYKEVVFNTIALETAFQVLGSWKKIQLECYQCNVNLPGSGLQPVHGDLGQLWPNMKSAHPPHGLIINIPLVDVDEHNGPMELYPKTHIDTSVWISETQFPSKPSLIAYLKKNDKPLCYSMEAGTVLIRDGRLWHRGTPNYSSTPRPMLTIMLTHPHIKFNLPPFPIEEDVLEFFQHPRISMNVLKVPKGYDWIRMIPN